MTITTRLHTYFNGSLVGEDSFGNRYFTEKKTPKDAKAKRWVLYKGLPEPSKVPAKWFGWLHYTTDKVPSKADSTQYSWEQPHIPNLTGTKHAYAPDGSLLETSSNAQSTDHYEAWTPKN